MERGPSSLSLSRCLSHPTSLTLLNYAEALTNFRPPMLLQPFCSRFMGTPVRLAPASLAMSIPDDGETTVPEWLIERIKIHRGCCAKASLPPSPPPLSRNLSILEEPVFSCNVTSHDIPVTFRNDLILDRE